MLTEKFTGSGRSTLFALTSQIHCFFLSGTTRILSRETILTEPHPYHSVVIVQVRELTELGRRVRGALTLYMYVANISYKILVNFYEHFYKLLKSLRYRIMKVTKI